MAETRKTFARAPIRPDRIRAIGPDGFAFVPNRFLRDGFLASLAPDELRLYVLLVLAGDRQGLSFYHYDSICSLLEMTLDDYIAARNGIIRADLVACDGTRFQVLSLPAAPTRRIPVADSVMDDDAPADDRRYPEVRAALLEALRRP